MEMLRNAHVALKGTGALYKPRQVEYSKGLSSCLWDGGALIQDERILVPPCLRIPVMCLRSPKVSKLSSSQTLASWLSSGSVSFGSACLTHTGSGSLLGTWLSNPLVYPSFFTHLFLLECLGERDFRIFSLPRGGAWKDED